jgi:hypothetical protein
VLNSREVSAEYAERLTKQQTLADAEQVQFRRIGNARLAAGISAAILAFFVFGSARVPIYWLALPIGLFFVLVVVHARIVQRLQIARRKVRVYERALARMEDRWMGTGEQGERFRDPNHVYAEDLDLFGKGSLYELLCTARTRAGEDRLAAWLLAPAMREEVRLRQAAVDELAPRVDLREELALVGEDIQGGLHAEKVSQWGQGPPVNFPPGLRILAVLLSTGTIVSLVGYFAGFVGRIPVLVFVLLQMGISLALRPRVKPVVEGVELPSHDLGLLSEMLSLVERETVQTPLLLELKGRLATQGLPASKQIAGLQRYATWLEWSHNEFFKPFAAILMWSTHIAVAIEKWRREYGPAIPVWIATAGEFEALSALACYRYEHPSDVFPEMSAGGAVFQAVQIGHPLLPEAHCIRNDISFGGELPLVIISGSNMSGKSTMLRTVGLNTVLAWAGAPVRAGALTISPVQVGASIRVQDSLQDGRSRFYAEITRLRQIVDLTTGKLPVLFLLDELLSGTNSHDREIGAAAIVHSLVERGAIGFLTTHDLALAHIAATVQPPGVNVHFVDTIEDGKLHFDYQLHPGVVERSNALELMRSVGLQV